jgi:hypothetical protein
MALLPELRVTEILPEILLGGTTKPVLVLAEDGKKYVLKLFGKRHAQQRCYTGAEVCAYFLAKEFDLFIPDAVLIHIPEEVLRLTERYNPALFTQLQSKDLSKPCFGSYYLESYPIYSPVVNDRLVDQDEFESIFAFDTLILNEDRRLTKPNVLRGVNHYYLIDHDKAFEGYKIASENYESGHLLHFHSYHLFCDQLKRAEKKDPGSVNFETFYEYLRSLDTSRINVQLHRLGELGYSVDECYNWLSFVEQQKKKCATFVALLIKHIKT